MSCAAEQSTLVEPTADTHVTEVPKEDPERLMRGSIVERDEVNATMNTADIINDTFCRFT